MITCLCVSGNAIVYFTYMHSVARNAGHGCVTLQSFLGQGLLDEPLEHYLRLRSRAFKSLCTKIRYLKVSRATHIHVWPQSGSPDGMPGFGVAPCIMWGEETLHLACIRQYHESMKHPVAPASTPLHSA